MSENGGVRCCSDVALHTHFGQDYLDGRPYRYRCEFKWAWPRVVLYTAAERRRFRVGLNRYPGIVIGAAVQIGQRVLSLVWGRPGRSIRIDEDWP